MKGAQTLKYLREREDLMEVRRLSYRAKRRSKRSAFQKPVKEEILGMELILCPSQPGNLYISRHACALRYLKAQKMNRSPFGYGASVVNRGFQICQTCPEGHRYAEEIF